MALKIFSAFFSPYPMLILVSMHTCNTKVPYFLGLLNNNLGAEKLMKMVLGAHLPSSFLDQFFNF